ncbi:beta-ketoacyl synthase N-terminal-like domain-containing protein [Streptomyces sp. NPDC057381]|uniref:beta-ketoacyl synthase N-terminal-like domain-containing protein n=1 Tax=Streptomyces sp. NPDC057381 TaxID=3346111 RepID=UPI003644F9EF
MNEREILTRFKAGTLGRDDAARLLAEGRQSGPRTPPPARPDALLPRPGTDAVAPPAGSYTTTPGGAPSSDDRTFDDRPLGDRTPADWPRDDRPLGDRTPADRTPANWPLDDRPLGDRTSGDRTPGDRVAVVGIAGRYPFAPDLHAHWENLRTGRDTSSAVPATRPGLTPAVPGRRGHFLDGVAEFDPEFFGIAPAEGALMDPQERLFLEVAWDALEDAGYTGSRLDALTTPDGESRAVGVFVGAASHDYALLAADAWTADGRVTPVAGHRGLPGRLADSLELTGPAQAVDTAECSALTALHLAVGALRRDECAAAVVGGVDLLLHPSRVRDGAGEGVGAVVLKPLRRALADGDRVHAVVRDTAGGRTARRRPDADATRRRTQGAHETRETTARRIGSAGAATGIEALTAAVLQVRHGALLPGAGESTEAPWPRTCDETGRRRPRTATVEVAADGVGVARAVVEEYVEEYAEAYAVPDGGVADGGDAGPFLLSAPTPAHLAATAGRLADWLSAAVDAGDPTPGPLTAGVARALRVGRAAMPCRAALPASRDVPGLVALLRRFADTGSGGAEAGTADLRDGRGDPLGLNGLPETRDYLAALWRAGRTAQLTRLWLNGVDVDWAALEAGSPRTVPVVPPPSARLRRPLWLGADGAPEEPEPNG